MTHLLCLGLGYCGQTLMRHLARGPAAENWRFSGTFRETMPIANEFGDIPRLDLMQFDGATVTLELRTAISSASHILHSVPPGNEGDPVLSLLAGDLAEAKALTWFAYLSTTGVYGDHQGGWVDETTARTPAGPRGARRLAAEDGWLASWRTKNLPVHIFRLPGIYGPGRNQLESLRAGTAKRIIKVGQMFSRIHVEDIARTLAASMAQPNPGAAYNVCDDMAAPPQDVVTFAAELLHVEAPLEVDFETADLSPMAKSFYSESKQVSNQRMKSELGIALKYPTYREGLRSLHDALAD
jgi:dTDP-4-dehydrorhamnose reductase